MFCVLCMDLECHLFEGFKLGITKWSLKNSLNRAHTESNTGHDDIGCHIMFEIATETHIMITPISISSWGTCSVVRRNKHNRLYKATLQLRRVENNINKRKDSIITIC